MNRGVITISESGTVSMPTDTVWMTMQEIADMYNVFGCYVRKSVTVKFSKPSYEALKLRARKANRKLAEYIRESALNGEVVSGHNAETVVIAKNLIGMANNLNQLTKLSHQRGFHETHVYVVDLLRRLKAILGEYRQASYKPRPSSMGRKEDTT